MWGDIQYNHWREMIVWTFVEALNSINFWIISPLSRSAFDFRLKSPLI